MLSGRFSLFGSNKNAEDNNTDNNQREKEILPNLKLQTDQNVYRPGDTIFVALEISNPIASDCSLLIENIAFEIKGIEKLDPQWFATIKPLSGSSHRRGEHVFLECFSHRLISNLIVSSSAKKSCAPLHPSPPQAGQDQTIHVVWSWGQTSSVNSLLLTDEEICSSDVVRATLPQILPPSYRGTTIRYLYYIKATLSARWLVLDNGHSPKNPPHLEARIPLQIWVSQKNNGLSMERGQNDGIVPLSTVLMDMYWKEMDGDSEWSRANDSYDGVEEGYESSRDEISSISSYNPTKENLIRTFGSSLSLQSSIARSSFKDVSYLEGEQTSISSYAAPPCLSVAEVLYDSTTDVLSPSKSSTIASPSPQKLSNPLSRDDNAGGPPSPRAGVIEPAASEGFIRGRSYNIRMDDQVLLRFSPKNSDPTYYFSDMIGGTLTFFHEEGARRCLELSVTLETSETISRRYVHPSRRNSPTITKIQSDHHEVVADLIQTSFLFSIPMDGPMSFSTHHVSVQWALRFEFLTTPKNVSWKRYEHPLLIEGRDKSEWVLPVTVHAPPPGTQAAHARKENSFSLEPLCIRT